MPRSFDVKNGTRRGTFRDGCCGSLKRASRRNGCPDRPLRGATERVIAERRETRPRSPNHLESEVGSLLFCQEEELVREGRSGQESWAKLNAVVYRVKSGALLRLVSMKRKDEKEGVQM